MGKGSRVAPVGLDGSELARIPGIRRGGGRKSSPRVIATGAPGSITAPAASGHVNLATTNRYADINIRTKEAALKVCDPQPTAGSSKCGKPVWRSDESMLAWLAS